ncbi:hypothetical protein [Actinomadura sp. HBU206391]|uniref:hypothetical protein n=1 Tax=Actinomadura sp. HBU206391 TaxID=2731692 RepID=UPI00164F353D|nr:hypothetical protein [Actinomadura sp. HBU206391]MBC6457366.1 hypothetical protein [Actinomadura sp. HBU206391]
MNADDRENRDRVARVDPGDRAGLARDVATAIEAVPGVAGLIGDAGPVQVATLHRHGKVMGVRLTDDTVVVHIVVNALPLQGVTTAVARAVRRVLSRAGDDRSVAVVVDALEGVSALPEHTEPAHTEPAHADPQRDHPEPGRREPGRPGPGRPEPGRPEAGLARGSGR